MKMARSRCTSQIYPDFTIDSKVVVHSKLSLYETLSFSIPEAMNDIHRIHAHPKNAESRRYALSHKYMQRGPGN
jgi:hypothetical protein